jgi:hypothetical protein
MSAFSYFILIQATLQSISVFYKHMEWIRK